MQATGARGEAAVRAFHNIGQEGFRFNVGGRDRTADGFIAKDMHEVKNVAHLTYMSQLKDCVAFAKSNGYAAHL